MSLTPKQPSPSLLVITTSGGGGHLQAANAKIAEEKLKNPQLSVTLHDLLAHAGGKMLGRFMISTLWDSAQRKGSVRSLEFLASIAPIFDVLFWLPVFFQILSKLIKHHITHIVDTQPLCVSAITSAVRFYGFLKKRPLVIEKIFTELPTEYASHYLSPIKRLPRKHRQMIRLITTHPLLMHHETEEYFWNRYCGLPLSNISYTGFPIRPSFKAYQQQTLPPAPLVLRIALKTPEEILLMKDIFPHPSHEIYFDNSHLVLTLAPQDKVMTLMLGSQPVQEASLSYVKTFIDVIRESKHHTTHHYLFVFCSHKTFEDTSLQVRLHDLIMNMPDYPKNLSIIPMSSQTDDVVAPLYFRSNATLTKAGGITSMELIAVANGKIWIHHEEKSSPLEKLLQHIRLPSLPSYKGMPKWEYGNATYLEKRKGAEIVSPETFADASKTYITPQ